MNTTQFLRLINTFEQRKTGSNETGFAYPDGGTIYLRHNPRGTDNLTWDVVATSTSKGFAEYCMGETELVDGKGEARWRLTL